MEAGLLRMRGSLEGEEVFAQIPQGEREREMTPHPAASGLQRGDKGAGLG
jgi:hypothetical protein